MSVLACASLSHSPQLYSSRSLLPDIPSTDGIVSRGFGQRWCGCLVVGYYGRYSASVVTRAWLRLSGWQVVQGKRSKRHDWLWLLRTAIILHNYVPNYVPSLLGALPPKRHMQTIVLDSGDLVRAPVGAANAGKQNYAKTQHHIRTRLLSNIIAVDIVGGWA